MDTKTMLENPGLWAGLNKPGLAVEDADVVVFGIPFDKGVSFRAGAAEGPAAIRAISSNVCATTEHFETFFTAKVLDLGDAVGDSREKVFVQAEKWAYAAVKAGKLLTMLGGDHSVTIPAMAGVNRAVDGPLGIIHIDAHFDLCQDMGGDRFSHGSTERRALELSHVEGVDNLFFVGIRSIEKDEVAFYYNNNVNVLTAANVATKGVEDCLTLIKDKMGRFPYIYVTIDIDCLDPAYAPGTGTPQFGGLSSRELLNLLKGIFDLPVVAFDVVEVAPSLDDSQIAVFAARKIITECWGHHFRKNRQMDRYNRKAARSQGAGVGAEEEAIWSDLTES